MHDDWGSEESNMICKQLGYRNEGGLISGSTTLIECQYSTGLWSKIKRRLCIAISNSNVL